MTVVRINELQVGMEVAEPVKSNQGVTLIPRSVVLAEKHLKILKAWGITEVTVIEADGDETVSDDDGIENLVDKEATEDVQKYVDSLFQKTDKNEPFIQELYRLALERKGQG